MEGAGVCFVGGQRSVLEEVEKTTERCEGQKLARDRFEALFVDKPRTRVFLALLFRGDLRGAATLEALLGT